MIKIVLDFEFTGLDNTFTNKHEIIQMKAININSTDYYIDNFGSSIESTIGAFLKHKIRSKGLPIKFSKLEFEKGLNRIGIKTEDIYDYSKVKYYGYSVSQDLIMLKKYGINLVIHDIKEMIQLTNEYEYKLATEGSSLECAYFMCFGKFAKAEDHSGMDEVLDIVEILLHVENLQKNKYLKYVPFGHCSGMDIQEYISDYRRNADGYRFNNDDIFSESLSYYIYENEMNMDDDDDFYSH